MVETTTQIMKIVVTGANGQLGSCLNQVSPLNNVEIVGFAKSQLNISDQFQVEEMMASLKPNWVINTAAYTNVDEAETQPDKAMQTNAIGPENLGLSAARHGAKLIQISTDYVFDGKSIVPYKEDDKKNPMSVYGATKSAGEDKVISAMKKDYYVLRTSWLYSEHKSNFAKYMADRAVNSRDMVEVVGDQFGQPTYAGDLAEQIFQLIRREPKSGIYHGTNSGRTSWFQFAREIFMLIGEDPARVEEISSSKLQRKAKRPANSALSHLNWGASGMKEMRNWKIALSESIPRILASLDKE